MFCEAADQRGREKLCRRLEKVMKGQVQQTHL